MANRQKQRLIEWFNHCWSGMYKPKTPTSLGKQPEDCIWTTTVDLSCHDDGSPLHRPVTVIVELDLRRDRLDIYRPETQSYHTMGGKIE